MGDGSQNQKQKMTMKTPEPEPTNNESSARAARVAFYNCVTDALENANKTSKALEEGRIIYASIATTNHDHRVYLDEIDKIFTVSDYARDNAAIIKIHKAQADIYQAVKTINTILNRHVS